MNIQKNKMKYINKKSSKKYRKTLKQNILNKKPRDSFKLEIMKMINNINVSIYLLFQLIIDILTRF